MASFKDGQTHLDNDTGSNTQPYERQCSPPEEVALQPLIPIPNQKTDIVACDAPPEGFVLLPPPGHEPVPSKTTMPNQETTLIPWTESRKPLEGHLAPPSSLPVWRYISPREENPAARLPTAMEHREHTPLPQFSSARIPDATPMLTEYKQHGITTYSSESTEEIGLDLNDRDDQDVLRYTDKVPMAGKYLQTAEHREAMRAQEDMLEEYSEHDVLDARNAVEIHKQPPRVPGR